jgi:hypothetical protein
MRRKPVLPDTGMRHPILKSVAAAAMVIAAFPAFCAAPAASVTPAPAAPPPGAAEAPVHVDRNRPVLDLPITDKKLVLAHYMTEFLNYKGNYDSIFTRLDLSSPDGPSGSMGGINQFKTIPSCLPAFRDLSMEAAAAFEMRTALKLGIDGFQFYYPCVPDPAFNRKYTEIIKAFFRAADAQHIDFKLTLCLSNANGPGTEEAKMAIWTHAITDILSQSRDSDKWLKSPDGRYVFYLYSQEGLAREVTHPWDLYKTPELVSKVADAYAQLAKNCGVDIAYIYRLRHPENEAYVNAVLDYFPAVWDWIDTDPDKTEKDWQRVAGLCRRRHRTYTQTVFSDYYGSKVYDGSNGQYRLMFNVYEVLGKDIKDIFRECMPTQLTYVFRRLLGRAVSLDAALINYATWNDYPEGHHIAPEINHNFAFPVLLRHFKDQWKGQTGLEEERILVFFKKYAHTVRPAYFDIPYRFQKYPENEPKDDFIDIETILDSEADLVFKGRKVAHVGKGLVSTLVPTEPGQVSVQVQRDGKTVLSLAAPEWITSRPYRTDRMTFAYSSDNDEQYHDIFGDAPVYVSNEYAESPHGINWMLNYHFQDTMVPKDAPPAGAPASGTPSAGTQR